MDGSEVDFELNELLLRLIEVVSDLRDRADNRDDLVVERDQLFERARERGLCMAEAAQA